MSLRATLEKIVNILSKQPNVEHQAKLKAIVSKLQKAAEDFQQQVELSAVENSVEYATLSGLLNDPARKRVATLTWANKHLRRLDLGELPSRSFTVSAKKQFMSRVLASGSVKEIINELSQTEEDRLQDFFARLSDLAESRIREELDRNFDKGPKLEAFCRANSVSVIKRGARTDRNATYAQILNSLASFRERQKL